MVRDFAEMYDDDGEMERVRNAALRREYLARQN